MQLNKLYVRLNPAEFLATTEFLTQLPVLQDEYHLILNLQDLFETFRKKSIVYYSG